MECCIDVFEKPGCSGKPHAISLSSFPGLPSAGDKFINFLPAALIMTPSMNISTVPEEPLESAVNMKLLPYVRLLTCGTLFNALRLLARG